MKDRIYVCHTFYHAYIATVKELNLPESQRGKATLVLSTMSNDFGSLREKALKSGLFEDVLMFDEKEDICFPEVMKYHADKGNTFLNLLQRIRYTKLLGKAQEENIPVDFKEYKDIYVFCDSDPIGYYLNYKKIRYHAVEDGLDTIKYCDDARYGNRGHFKLKAFMAKLNLIFIENGYSKYCIDMEVNDISALKYKLPNYVEAPREKLFKGIPDKDRHYLMDIFMDDPETLLGQLRNIEPGKKKVMILSDPVCDYETRKKMMRDIINEYAKDASVMIKPHPRDVVDYKNEFRDCIIIKGRFPMEILNEIPEFKVDRVVSILTVVDAIGFADERIFLGADFMDRYEDPAIHRQNEVI
ncbi:MAG: lipooligosaccharide sialyltransferase [Lachnospiraceae bacterium]|nr:lipooligosaccharide sialyltransferase [Lachnospiraceae bacterium]